MVPGALIIDCVWLVYSTLEQRKHPSTSFAVSNEIYMYPDLWVCLYDTYGCDKLEDEEQCVSSIFDTEGGSTNARYRPGDADETLINLSANFTEERGWCVIFETSALDYNLGSDRDPDDYIDYSRVDMYWFPGGSENNSTTCIQEAGAWTSHKENIFAFLKDPVTDEVSAGIQIPYSCITSESNSHYFTYVGIGVTEEFKVNGDETALYNALTLSTVEHKDEDACWCANASGYSCVSSNLRLSVSAYNPLFQQISSNITGIRAPYAYLAMQLQQESDSLAVITEIDPLDFAEILGEIGGFWDLILIVWPIFFVTLSNEPPYLKARNFRKSVVRAKETAVKKVGLPTITQGWRSSTGRRRRSLTIDGTEEGGRLPDWDRVAPPLSHQQESEVLIRLFEDHKLVAVVDASSRVGRFLQSKLGARYLRSGASETLLGKLLPAKTYLVEVPANHTATSIAMRIAGHCKAGGDQTRSAPGPLVVKVMKVSCSELQSQVLAASSYVPAGDNKVEESFVNLGEILKGVCLPLSRLLLVIPGNSSRHISKAKNDGPNDTDS